MDMNTIRGLITAVLILVFLGIVAWAWSARRKSDFDAAARLPLEEDEQEAGTGGLVK
jgi:cytochrome c oxidase cbb3-type subunit 4